jgi:hypothetical protein
VKDICGLQLLGDLSKAKDHQKLASSSCDAVQVQKVADSLEDLKAKMVSLRSNLV